jgi:hypothetical protein
MEELGNIFNTDKVTHHKYHEIYPLYIKDFEEIKEG